MEAFCKVCDSLQEVERTEEGSDVVYCVACGEEFTLDSSSSGSGGQDEPGKYANFRVGCIMRVEPIAKSKDLKLCHINVTSEADADQEDKWIPVVTNTKYVEAGWKVVVACLGAIVPAGATLAPTEDEDGDIIRIKKRSVQGVESRGMLCDCPMLGWSGGAKGIVQRLPDTFEIGVAPPDSRPRLT